MHYSEGDSALRPCRVGRRNGIHFTPQDGVDVATDRVDGQIEKARDFARQALILAQDIQHPWGAALAQRILGRIAHTSGNLPEAESHLQEALATCWSIQAQYELARIHLDLSSLAHTQDNPDITTTHLSTAYAWFKKLQVPKWMERTEQLACEYGVTLKEVELEEFETEGEP